MAQDKIVYSTDKLEVVNPKNGRKKFWQAFVIKVEEGNIYYYTVTSAVLADGSIGNRKQSELNECVGKNVGRTNQTDPQTQATLEVVSKAKKMRDMGYVLPGEESIILPLPMLAEHYEDHLSAIKFPCALQPKYNGNRAMYSGDQWWTRKGQLYNAQVVEHLQLGDTGDNIIFDGEMMLPPPHLLAKIASRCKKYYGPDDETPSSDLTYHVFDLYDVSCAGMTFRERNEYLVKWFADKDCDELGAYLAPTYNCRDERDVREYFERAVGRGYEGVMLRNWDSLYLPGYGGARSTDLLKLKPMQDGEYEIVNCVYGKGKEAEAIMYVCVTEKRLAFRVHPEGSIKERKKLWKLWEAGKYDPRGKMYTIRYQELTEDGIPMFAVGVAVRDYE